MLNDFLTENVYPSTDLANRNLDFMIRDLQKMMVELKTFVSINSVKYADPIRWDITRQYEKNTIVIDPLTGTAYISVAAVPIGIALTRTEYWTPVFDLEQFVTKGAKNFTSRFEEQTTLTATFPTPVNGWLVWNSTLYRALTNIVAGDQYTPDSNIKEFTMEDVIGHPEDVPRYEEGMSVCDLITGLYNFTTGAVEELLNFIGDLSNLTTENKSSLVAAINELVNNIDDLSNNIGDLANLTTSDKSSIVNAINENVEAINTLDEKVGDLADLQTEDKTSIVNAINELITIGNVINVKDFGAIGDGITDDTAAIQNAFNAACSEHKPLYFPAGIYGITQTLDFTNTEYYTIIGVQWKSYIKALSSIAPMIRMSNNDSVYYGSKFIYGLVIDGNNLSSLGIEATRIAYSIFYNIAFLRISGNCINSGSWVNTIKNCSFQNSKIGINLLTQTGRPINNFIIDSNNFYGVDEGVKVNTYHDIKIINNTFDQCKICAIELITGGDEIVIHSNYFEGCGKGGGISLVDENNNTLLFNGTIIIYGDRGSVYSAYHNFISIKDNYFVNCLRDQIIAASHIANTVFLDNSFSYNYDAIVKLLWHGSNYVFARKNVFIANETVDTAFTNAIKLDTMSSLDHVNVIARVIKRFENNTESPLLIDLMSIQNLNNNMSETGSATASDYYNGDISYELSNDYLRDIHFDLSSSNLKGKYVTIDALYKNITGYDNGLNLVVRIDNVVVLNYPRHQTDNAYHLATFGAGFLIPDTASDLEIVINPTYNTSGIFITKCNITA